MRFVRVTEIVITEDRNDARAYSLDFDQPARFKGRVTVRAQEGWLPISRSTYMREADPDLRVHGVGTEVFLAGLARDDYRICVRETLAEIWRRYDEDFRFVEVTDRRGDLAAAEEPG